MHLHQQRFASVDHGPEGFQILSPQGERLDLVLIIGRPAPVVGPRFGEQAMQFGNQGSAGTSRPTGAPVAGVHTHGHVGAEEDVRAFRQADRGGLTREQGLPRITPAPAEHR